MTREEVAQMITPGYGYRDRGVMKEVDIVLDHADATLKKLASENDFEKFDLVALDWAGIGDAVVHSRLILEHLLPTHPKMAWITIPKVAPLFADDDKMVVLGGFQNNYRCPSYNWVLGIAELIGDMLARIPCKKRLDVSGSVCKYFATWWSHPTNYSDLFFSACGVQRDPSVHHTIKHNGVPTIALPARFMVIEHVGCTCGPIPTPLLDEIVATLKGFGVDSVVVGAALDPEVKNTVDARGLSLYDTLSIMKRSIGVLGKSSGNQSLTCFLRDIPLFETHVVRTASYQECGLRAGNAYWAYEKDTVAMLKDYFSTNPPGGTRSWPCK